MATEAAVVKPEVSEEGAAIATPKDAATLAEYSPVHRMVEIASIATFFSVSAWLCWRLASVAQGADWLILLAGVGAGYVGSDFTSGLVHWGFDTWGSIYTPFLGKNFIRPFREHHFDEKAITRHDFVETNGNNCLVSLPILAGIGFVTPAHGAPWTMFFVTMALGICIGTMLTNQIHKWSHEDEPPAFIVALQKVHLILPPDHHQLHHTPPYDTHYCITTGWLNAGLRAIRFYRIAERVITATTGAQPRRDDLAT